MEKGLENKKTGVGKIEKIKEKRERLKRERGKKEHRKNSICFFTLFC